MKMYILIKDTIPLGLALVAAAHASLACFRKFEHTFSMQDWLSSFKKVVCKVNEKEFEKAKEFEDNVILIESALNGQETAIAFCPRKEFPKEFKFFKLYN